VRFDGKVAVITGGANGMGRAHSRRLASEGAAVVIADIAEEAAQRLAAELPRALAVKVDVTNEAECAAMAAAAVEAFGRIDILVNNAGGGMMHPTSFWEITEATWDLVVDVNLKGQWLCAKAVFPAMREAGAGRIINIASRSVYDALPIGLSPYFAAKSGAVGLTRAIARELGPYNITVNSVAPGAVGGDVSIKPYSPQEWEEMGKRAVARQTIQTRRVNADDLAATVAFLASEEAELITGQLIFVDGGVAFH
jgi:3-oxoacyl-[acyl-carrier protein] reductase